MANSSTPTSPPRKASWVVRFRWPAVALGLVLLGGSLTYLLVPPTFVTGDAISVDPADLVAAAEREAQAMPSVLGLNGDVAQTVLADAGLSGIETELVERPAAGPVGMVLSQNPSPGTNPVESIELTVSTPTQMPDVMGKSLDDARAQLEQLGAVVEIVPRFDPTVPKDQVIEFVPKTGETVPTVVTLTVADPGDALTLASVSSIDYDSCSTVDGVTVNGATVGDSIECDSGEDVAYIEYALSRNASALEAQVGTNDRGGTGAATVTVWGDGRQLATVEVWLGQSVPLRADVTGVMRLRIDVTTVGTEQNPSVVLADAKLLGLPAGLDAIAAQ